MRTLHPFAFYALLCFVIGCAASDADYSLSDATRETVDEPDLSQFERQLVAAFGTRSAPRAQGEVAQLVSGDDSGRLLLGNWIPGKK